MALIVADRVRETTSTVGTGAFALGGAQPGFQAFSAVLTNGDTTYYACAGTTEWEVGVGTWNTGNTLSRTTVLASSNSGNLVNFSAGTKDIFISYPASRSVYQNEAGTSTVQQAFSSLSATSANITTATITSGTVSTTPASGNDIANKTYVDTTVSSGITYHSPVKYEVPNSTGNLNAIYNQPGGPGVGVGATLTNNGTLAAFAPDGPTAAPGDRILVYNQTNAFENGVYTVTTVGNGSTPWVLTRATDADTYALKSPNGLGLGDAFFITSGNTGAGETYVCNTSGTITFGTTAINFVQVSSAQIYSAGTGLTLSGTQFSITNTGVGAATYGSASAVPVIGVNAQGQITSATNTTIAITGAQVSGNIAGSAGSVANALTAGSYLTSGGTYDGSVARTFAVDATSANTASKVVARDASGDFSAGTITASLSGNATSANTSTNISGGTANQIPYQASAGTTTFVAAPTTANTYLSWTGSAYTWATTGTFTSATISGSLTLSGGTANGVAYLNGSKVLTTGSALTFDGSNLGVGLTPSAWGINYRVVEFDQGTSASGFIGDANNQFMVGRNAYHNGTNWTYYASSTPALLYQQSGAGEHLWYNAPSGTVGNTITFTQRMTLDVNGNLGIGTTSPAAKADVVGTVRATSQTVPASGTGAELFYDATNAGLRGYNRTGSAYVNLALNDNVYVGGGSSGNVGIGTSSPTQKLEVAGSVLLNPTNPALAFNTLAYQVYKQGTSLRLYANSIDHLVCDGAGNVGIGTSSPAYKLDVVGPVQSSAGYYINGNTSGGYIWVRDNYALRFGTNDTERMRLDSSGNLGIGTSSPGQKLEVAGNIFVNVGAGNPYLELKTAGAGNNPYVKLTADTNYWELLSAFSQTNDDFLVRYNGTALLDLDKNGNLGLGVTPSAWGGTYKAIQILGYGASLVSSGAGNTLTSLTHNSYHNGTNWVYNSTGIGAARYEIDGPSGGATYKWFTAPSGTAGNAITFTQAMTLDSSGNLGLGTTPSPWGSAYKAFDMAAGAVFNSLTAWCGIATNAYVASSGSWTYKNTNVAGLSDFLSGQFRWWSAGSGTAGTTVTFTNLALLNSTGLSIGTGSNPVYRLDVSGTGYATGDFRAPIFYDSGNTNNYIRPNVTSTYTQWSIAGNKNSYGGIYDIYSAVNGIMYDSGGNGGVYREATGKWYFYYNVSNDCMGVGTASTNSTYGIYCNKGAYLGGRTDVTILYDANNSAYYVDPASTSLLNILNLPSGSAAINTTTPGIGTYQLNFTGQGTPDYAQAITWGWSSSGAQAGIYVQSSGSYGTKMYLATTDSFAVGSKTAMSIDHTGIITATRDSFRAPYFYDSNNTAYYGDFASTSVVNQINMAGYLRRTTSAAGYLEGYYATATDSNSSMPIYTIGGAYQPGTTSLGNMYGIGYTYGTGTTNPGLGISEWGLYVASNGTSRIFLGSDTGIGVATASWRAPIFYDRDNTAFYTDPASTSIVNNVQITTLGVGTAASGTTGEIRATNNITAYYSDERLKTRLGLIDNALDKLLSLEGFYYEANEVAQALGYTPVREVGVSAQAVQKILPEVVAPAPIDDKYLTVRYEKLVPLLIEAIKELSAKVDELQKRN